MGIVKSLAALFTEKQGSLSDQRRKSSFNMGSCGFNDWNVLDYILNQMST